MTTATLGQYLRSGIFEARCIDCGEVIGTFTPDGILRAMLSTIDRGGVKCPICRQNSCEFCGLPVCDTTMYVAVKPRKEDGPLFLRNVFACTLCVIERDDEIVSVLGKRGTVRLPFWGSL